MVQSQEFTRRKELGAKHLHVAAGGNRSLTMSQASEGKRVDKKRYVNVVFPANLFY